jgi:diguanylate cyclase (GGDEF)-like protein/PAS domain S-box-containing protein
VKWLTNSSGPTAVANRPHPRTVGWFGTTAVAMGGINQSLFLIGVLFVGQEAISGQGSAAVVLLGIGLLLSWAAAPGWTELILMYPNRVGGIAATCAEAFRPYSPVLANLTGVCYWWGWVPTCGLTALLAASAVVQWYVPQWSVPLLASCIVAFFTVINLCGVKWVMRLAMPIATLAAVLAFLSAIVPVAGGQVNWERAFTFSLTVPFDGWFGQVTSVMAGLYLVGFAAPAFEQAACHVGETIDPEKNVPRAMLASAAMASLYFIVLPVIWLGTLGPEPLGKELALELGPTFAPLLAGSAKAVAIWFMVLNMLHGTIAPLAGAARTLAQLSEDGLLPESWAKRSSTDAPWVTTLLTAAMSILFLLIGDPVWLIAAANLTYLVGIALPSVAVWLLRKNEPLLKRPYRAPHGTIALGLGAAAIWGLTVILGFQQFGLPTVLIGLVFAYSGAVLYAWRKYFDRRKAGLSGIGHTLHIKLTGAMLLVLAFDAGGYLLAVRQVPSSEAALIAALEDIFVAVALLTFFVGLILPGMIAHSAVQVSQAADRLIRGTMADFTRAMRALAKGDLANARASADIFPVAVFSKDEVGDMALNFNRLQLEIGRAAQALDGAREGLSLARAELTDRNDQLRVAAIAFESLEGMCVTDVDLKILRVNRAFTVLTGYEPEEVMGRLPGMVWSPDTQSPAPANFYEALIAQGHWSGETMGRRKGGDAFPAQLTATAVLDVVGSVTHYVITFGDITQSKAAAEEIQRLAFYDALTGLPNRRLLVDRLQQSMATSQRQGWNNALLFIDLDEFKVLNDTLGHAMGDRLLCAVTQRITANMRDVDTVARLGGDEFVVILTQLSSDAETAVAQVEAIGQKLRLSLNERYMLDGREIISTPSIGASLFSGTRITSDELLRHADIAMYQAKAAGRNALRFFDPAMQRAISHRAALEADLRHACETQQFEVYYQVQVDDQFAVIGAEALLRWHHPTRGMILPGEFIALAESSGLILPQGQWVLEQVCRQLARWTGHPVLGELHVSVNVSARQFKEPDFVEHIAALLRTHRIRPRNLQIELTESQVMESIHDAIEKMQRLKALGVRISIDDFGTGYSSLSYLTRLPLDQLKVDRSFVRNICDKASDLVVAQTIIGMAHRLGIEVIAEGVETAEQRSLLLINGCHLYQGYLFGHPVTVDTFAAGLAGQTGP